MWKFIVKKAYGLFELINKPFQEPQEPPSQYDLDLPWQTRGIFGDGPLLRTKLGNCDSNHLISILATQKWISTEYADAIKRILLSRNYTRQELIQKIKERSALPTFKTRD
jgi:hypothetical protein